MVIEWGTQKFYENDFLQTVCIKESLTCNRCTVKTVYKANRNLKMGPLCTADLYIQVKIICTIH